MAIIVVATLSVGFVSCGDDDDEVSIVGTWRYDDSEGYDLFVFKSDGSGIYEEYEYVGNKAVKDGSEKFTYVFNAGTGVLKVVWEDNDVETFKIVFSSSNKFVIDGKDVFVKQ